MSSPSAAASGGVVGAGGSSCVHTSKSKHEVSAEDTVAGRLNQQRANKDNGICKPDAHEPTSVAMLTQESSRRTPAFRARGHRGRGGRRAEVKAHTEQAEPASSTPPTGAIRSRGHQQPNEHHTPPMLVAELENAQAHSKRLEGELRRAQDKFRRSSERAAAERLSGREREEKLNAALADAEQRLQMLKNEKLAARIFGETEDVDGKAIVNIFGNVVDGVNDLAFCLVDMLDEAVMTSTLVLERVSRLDDADQLAGRIVRPFLVLMAQVGGKVEEAALPAMQCMAFSVLVSWIFHPMSLAGQIPQVTRQFMKQLTSRMAALKPQEQYGRWRAMTFGAMRRPSQDVEIARVVAKKVLESLENVLVAMLPPTTNHNSVASRYSLAELHDRATKVVLDAIQLQDTIQQVYVSHDYSVFFTPVDTSYSARKMTTLDLGPDMMKKLRDAVQQAACPRGTVLLPVIPGLRARRVGSDLSCSDVVVKKVSVVALL